MAIMISRRKLDAGDYDAWKARFEEGASARAAAGCRGARRFRNLADPDEVIVIFDWDSLENARAYVGIKLSENARLSEERSPGGPPKLENIFVEELPLLPS
ncbi:hypothetical protein CSC62_08720 [Pseudoxanthomonas jiangsuensis]|uniref:antibiotic biosynthesis monooxygenase n=1 Tax=Pseudoxanthomonas jiangsuensis TaxID=619688 RepID=UPI0013914526|nr:antibiotic biosynthesis monooxygenase [Pseudoxanthomonas jiangsuensis]KAF1697273.1 hypothetical protein CSC62_08720 [Pseudoxanthomonas jiangsuensis]